MSICTVRPFAPLECAPCDDDGCKDIGDSHILPELGQEVIMGSGDIIDADTDDVVQKAIPLPTPKTPTAMEIAVHNLTHLPFRCWCPHCTAARRPNTQHRRQPSQNVRATPLLVADYCFIGDQKDEAKIPVLVACVYP